MSELKRNKPFRRSSNSSLSSRASNVSFSEKVRRESTAKFDNFMKECRAAYLAVLSSTTEKITSIDELILGKNYSVTFFQRELPEFFFFCSSFLAAITMELYAWLLSGTFNVFDNSSCFVYLQPWYAFQFKLILFPVVLIIMNDSHVYFLKITEKSTVYSLNFKIVCFIRWVLSTFTIIFVVAFSTVTLLLYWRWHSQKAMISPVKRYVNRSLLQRLVCTWGGVKVASFELIITVTRVPMTQWK